MNKVIQQWFQSLIFLAFLLMGGAPAFAAVCDVDNDGDVDRLDINLIFTARNQPASGPGDPRDADGNGTINVLDGRKCTLQCSLPNCAIKNPKTPPKADAGPDQTGRVGDRITLNGAASSDADGNALSFMWVLQLPVGSAAALSDPNVVSPQFTIDQKGDYIAELIVNDGYVDSAPDEVAITTSNSAPVANAGPDQSMTVAAIVTLNGAGSSDVDGDPLTFAWSFTSKPAGSSAFLSDSTSVNPQFVADRPGGYVLNLVVNDGTVDSPPDEVVISSENTPPVAHAGPDQTVPLDTSVTLDGSGSSDADQHPLTYSWSLTSNPQDSAAALSSPTAVNPNFVADLPGLYLVQLIVNDGFVNSAPDTVQISTINSVPVANAGPDQTVVAGASVQLDGSGSTDVDGNPISYHWSFTMRPTGSNAVLSDATVVNPTFTADVLGDYVLQLIVNDGFVDSAPDTVQISTSNTAPVANAGPDQTVAVGSLVQLNGSASGDADDHPLTYSWSLTSKPTGSAATLSSLTAVDPSFVADQPGNYVVQLVVNDGFVNSPVDTVQISTSNSVPVANAGPDQSVLAGAIVTLDGSGSNDADGDPLTYQWSILSAPTGSTAALSDSTAQKPTLGAAALPLIAGTYVLQLIVNDTQVNSPPDTMTLQVGGGGISLSLVGTQVVGVNRDATVRVTLPQAAPAGGVTVTVTSDNAGILAVSAPGTVSITEGQTIGQVTVNGVSAGTTVLRGNATGFTEGSLSVTVTLNLISMPTTLNVPLGKTTNLPVTIAPDPAPAGGVVVNVISSDLSRVRVDTPTVTIPPGQISANATVFGAGIGSMTVNGSSPDYAADVTVTSTTASINIVEGNQTINNSFGGNITVRLESPPGTAFAAPAGGVQVTGAGITLSGMEAVGSGLMGTANTATLGASNHGGVTVRIASSNPTVALVSPNASTVGTAFFDAAVANGSTQASFVVHGVEGVTGTVTVTASAPGFTDGTGAATIVQPALRLAGLAATTTALAGNDDFVVQVGVPTAGNTTLNAVRAVRAGSAGVTATVSNSAATVGQLVTIPGSAQTRTVAIAAGQSASPASLAAGGVQFDPLAGGTTQVSGSIPGFITTTAGNVTVTVTP